MFKPKYPDYIEMYCLKLDQAKSGYHMNAIWTLARNYISHKQYAVDIHWSELG